MQENGLNGVLLREVFANLCPLVARAGDSTGHDDRDSPGTRPAIARMQHKSWRGILPGGDDPPSQPRALPCSGHCYTKERYEGIKTAER